MTITPEVIAAHQLTASEYQKIVDLLGRDPSLTELGIFGVMWSEHCSYKSTRVHLKKLPTESRHVLQGPGENAGIIDIGDGLAIAFKIESHNHPSFIEPFQGAATGVGGILRDIFTMGARPIAVMDSIRFGKLDDPATGDRNRHILESVVSGIAHYGNSFGVATVGGECVFDESYDGNPLVNVFALGVFRHDEIFYGKASGVGNPVIYVGAKTGRDGIHGASMASAEFTEESKQKRPNVQVGDPFMEKLLLEACLEAMKTTTAIIGIQDMGAAGLTSSTCEMGSRAGTGIEIDLQYVPQRETGMTPYEMMLSESQERMLLVAERGRESELFPIFHKWGVDAVTIGVVTSDGMLRVKDHGKVYAEIPNRALADEAPRYHRPFTRPLRTAPLDGPFIQSTDLLGDLKALLQSGDLCSKRWIWEQYDYQVRTNTLAGPGSDAAVVRIKGTETSVAMSLDGNSRYCALDPREGTKLIVAECCRNLASVGALPLATTNNLNFGNPERPEIMAQIVESIEGLAEACKFFEAPVTGGNVSLYNETLGTPILPTPVVGIVGTLKTAPPVGVSFKRPGLSVILVGGLGNTDARQMGATQYAKVIHNSLWGLPPQLDMAYEKQVHATVRELVRERVVESAHDLGEGGLAVALAESCFGSPGVGVGIDLDSDLPLESLLFHEGPSRVLVSTATPNEVFASAKKNGVQALQIGVTLDAKVVIRNRNQLLIDSSTQDLQEVWDNALEKLLGNSVQV